MARRDIPLVRTDQLLGQILRDKRYDWSPAAEVIRRFPARPPVNYARIGRAVAERCPRDFVELLMLEAPCEAELFCIEGEILTHEPVMRELLRRLRARGIRPWLVEPHQAAADEASPSAAAAVAGLIAARSQFRPGACRLGGCRKDRRPMTTRELDRPALVYDRTGFCPICAAEVRFTARQAWFRDFLHCSGCRSIPRERALALVLEQRFPDWRGSHPRALARRRGISAKLGRECPGYVATQFFPDRAARRQVEGFRNENLEALTFPTRASISWSRLDVMEHVNRPDEVLREVARTLRPGGAYLFTVPTYKGRLETERRAHFRADGSVEHLAEPDITATRSAMRARWSPFITATTSPG